MKPWSKICLYSLAGFVALCGASSAQSTNPSQARADADLARQRSESLAVQRKNEKTDKDERTQFEARKKGYEKEALQKRQTLKSEKSQAKPKQGEIPNIK